MLQALFALFRFPFSLSVHLYIFKVTDGSSRHPHFAACISDCFRRLFLVLHLVCLSKVYQRSLFFFSFRFYRKADAKVNAFFHSAKLFGSFFSKKFFSGKPEGKLSRSLGQYQGKILAQSRADPQQNFSACRFSYLSPLSRKRLQRYSLFPFLQILWNTFFKQFSIIFIINCKSIMF